MRNRRLVCVVLSVIILSLSLGAFGLYSYKLWNKKKVTYKDGIMVERSMEDEEGICEIKFQC